MSGRRFPEEFEKRVKNIEALLLDVDGVMTDGGMIFNRNGEETKRFNSQDGLGIVFARMIGLKLGFITARSSEAVRIRADELGMHFLSMGQRNKLTPYKEFKDKFKLSDEQIAYVGDDVLDLPVMKRCGFAVTVDNGRPEVKEHAHYVASAAGGNGAVREIIELILRIQNKWDSFIERFLRELEESDKK